MQVLENKIENLERRVSKLEGYRDNDFKIINQHNENLATIVLELKNVTKSLETITTNWKEAINRSNAKQKEEHENINNRISALEKNVSQLTIKQETDTINLEKTLDERTIIKDSKNYQKYIFEIVKYIVIAIVGFVVALVLK